MIFTPEAIAARYCLVETDAAALAEEIKILINHAYTDAADIASEVKDNQSGATYLIAEEIEQQINAMKLTVSV
jgi:F0F1-type ATP synthase assembly protein I